MLIRWNPDGLAPCANLPETPAKLPASLSLPRRGAGCLAGSFRLPSGLAAGRAAFPGRPLQVGLDRRTLALPEGDAEVDLVGHLGEPLGRARYAVPGLAEELPGAGKPLGRAAGCEAREEALDGRRQQRRDAVVVGVEP